MPQTDGPLYVAAEQRLLAAVLLDRRVWEEIGQRFRPEWFASPEHYAIALEILADAQERPDRPPSVSSVGRRLAGKEIAGARALDLLMRATDAHLTSDEAAPLADMLDDLCARRAADAQLREALSAVHDQSTPWRDALAKARESLLQVESAAGDVPVHTWDDAMAEWYADTIERQDGRTEPAWPTGLAELNRAIKGLRRGDLVVVAGRTSMGKSALALHLAMWLARERKVHGLIISLEMPRHDWIARAMAGQAVVESGRLYDPASWRPEERERVNRALSALSGLPVAFADTRGLSLDRIATVLRQRKARDPELGLVVVDHLTLIRLDGNARRNRSDLVGEASRRLRELAGELDVCLLLLAQLNRDLERRDDKRPKLADLRESGEIEEHADVVVGLYREEYYAPVDPDDHENPARNVCEIEVLKGRRTGTGGALVRFDPAHCRFEDLHPAQGREYKRLIAHRQEKRGGKAVAMAGGRR